MKEKPCLLGLRFVPVLTAQSYLLVYCTGFVQHARFQNALQSPHPSLCRKGAPGCHYILGTGGMGILVMHSYIQPEGALSNLILYGHKRMYSSLLIE